MKILCIGDIVGRPGREIVRALLSELRKRHKADFVLVNAENAAGGAGLTPRLADELLEMGCDVLTLGDHTWDKRELYDYLSSHDRIIRPANFPDGAPGRGWEVIKGTDGQKIGVINLLGRVFMRYNVDCPFKKLREIAAQLNKETPVVVADMHAEATSEKIALGHFIDGDVSVLVGTHTHVQTADEKVLPKGTAYITDLGMTGPHDSVIGQDKERIVERFLTSLPHRFQVAEGDVRLNGVVVDVDETSGRARKITRIQEFVPNA